MAVQVAHDARRPCEEQLGVHPTARPYDSLATPLCLAALAEAGQSTLLCRADAGISCVSPSTSPSARATAPEPARSGKR
jgi:hypothetical protein